MSSHDGPLAQTPAAPLDLLRHAWAVSWLGQGIEKPERTPSVLVYDEPHARLHQIAPHEDQRGNPVLLVTPLAVPWYCWDLRPGQSMAAHLSGADGEADGRPTYIIGYGDMGFADRGMGFEDWLDRILPTAVEAISARHGGAKVHLVGWSLGGTLSLLTASHRPELPIASIVAVGTPIDYARNASAKPLMWLDALLGTWVMTRPTALLGGVPAPVVQAMFRALAPTRELTKPWFLLRNLHDRDALARTEAIDGFIGSMPGYPGRFYHQLHARIISCKELMSGVVRFGGDHDVHLDRLRVPLLFVGSSTDAIASAAAVEGGVAAFSGAPSAEYAAADGLSHLGLIAHQDARTRSWPLVTKHLSAHDQVDFEGFLTPNGDMSDPIRSAAVVPSDVH